MMRFLVWSLFWRTGSVFEITLGRGMATTLQKHLPTKKAGSRWERGRVFLFKPLRTKALREGRWCYESTCMTLEDTKTGEERLTLVWTCTRLTEDQSLAIWYNWIRRYGTRTRSRGDMNDIPLSDEITSIRNNTITLEEYRILYTRYFWSIRYTVYRTWGAGYIRTLFTIMYLVLHSSLT